MVNISDISSRISADYRPCGDLSAHISSKRYSVNFCLYRIILDKKPVYQPIYRYISQNLKQCVQDVDTTFSFHQDLQHFTAVDMYRHDQGVVMGEMHRIGIFCEKD